MPERIRLRRTKGYRKPEDAVVVARPTKWGNPFRIVPGFGDIKDPYQVGAEWPCPSLPPDERHRESAREATDLFRLWWTEGLTVITRDDGRFRNLSIARGATVDVEQLADDETATLHGAPRELRESLHDLACHDLACWCPLDQPCHADVLLAVANGHELPDLANPASPSHSGSAE